VNAYVNLNRQQGTLAQDLKAMCPVDVFDIEDIGGTPTAVAARPRNCTMCRECIRLEGWNDGSRVKLLRKADHFIFSVESTGALPAQRIVKEAIKVLRDKAGKFTEYVDDQIQMEE
jgi:DNA-directed RNA polymerase I and III subunit RPAC1